MKTERARRLKEIEELWKEKTGKTDLRIFDKQINERFQVSDGRDALSFVEMDLIKEGLEKL